MLSNRNTANSEADVPAIHSETKTLKGRAGETDQNVTENVDSQ